MLGAVMQAGSAVLVVLRVSAVAWNSETLLYASHQQIRHRVGFPAETYLDTC